MKDRVVCLKTFLGKHDVKNGSPSFGNPPIKGEIYTVSGSMSHGNVTGYSLKELHPRDYWNIIHFRPVDDSFGEWCEETILKEAVLEESLKELTV